MPSNRARKIGTASGEVGHLVWFSVPETRASYDQLKDLAKQVGLHEDYTPGPPTSRDAWRKATNTGKRGIKIARHSLNQHKVDRAELSGDGTPRAYVRTVEISRSAPLLVRHLVLFVVLPGADRQERQLEVGTVAVLEFDTETLQARSIVGPARNQDWVTVGHIDSIVRQMDIDMSDYIGRADNNKIRASVRDLIEDLHRVCLRNTGGVYFVPMSASHVHMKGGHITTAQDGLQAMKRWVDEMDRWAADPKEPPMFRKVVLDGENAQELRADIIGSAIEQFQNSLQEIANSLGPVFEGRAVGRTADNIVENAVAALGNVMDGARAYRDSVNLELSELEAMFRMAHQAVTKAQAQGSTEDDMDAEDIMALLAD